MSTKTKIKWRLGNLPTPEEVTLLLTQQVLTKEEAREILFSLETEEDRTKKSLQDEIKFLRELVAKLSINRSVIIETIRQVESPWKKQDWFQPYYVYATSQQGSTANLLYTYGTGTTTSTTTSANSIINPTANNAVVKLTSTAAQQTGSSDFTTIKTF